MLNNLLSNLIFTTNSTITHFILGETEAQKTKVSFQGHTASKGCKACALNGYALQKHHWAPGSASWVPLTWVKRRQWALSSWFFMWDLPSARGHWGTKKEWGTIQPLSVGVLASTVSQIKSSYLQKGKHTVTKFSLSQECKVSLAFDYINMLRRRNHMIISIVTENMFIISNLHPR